MDESYLPFVEDVGDASLAARDLPNVIVLQSLSKMFCIPGLRIGFCIAPVPVAEKMALYLPPWGVNALAQESVHYIAANTDQAARHVADTRKYLLRERNAFMDRLNSMENLFIFPGKATFMLIRLSRCKGPELVRHMLDRKILIRDCSNFFGLSDQFVRISLKGQEENKLAAEHIGAFSKDSNSLHTSDDRC